MRISYKVDGKYIIESASLPIQSEKVYLITGVETSSFALLGGLIAKLIPIREELDWPQLQALLEPYSGTLEISDGELPTTTAYVGVDPERHLLFSKVREEFLAQTNGSKNPESSLQVFGLDESFLDRQISSLSGGEKTKVALSIAFSQQASCYLLHGVIPWLDKKGRAFLRGAIGKARADGATIILLEQEIHPFLDLLDGMFIFDGKSLTRVENIADFTNSITNLRSHNRGVDLSRCSKNKTEHAPVLAFNNVTLRQHPFAETTRTSPLLENITLTLHEHRSYFLLGENGSGKSTLAQLALRVIQPTSGEVLFSDKPIARHSRENLVDGICYLAQFPEQQITLSNYGQYRRKAEQTKNHISLQLMQKYLLLPDNFSVSQLSFLQMKLLCLTSFVTSQTRLIILDEPTWGLDLDGQNTILKVLNEIGDQLCIGLLVISHDLTLVHSLSGSVLWLKNGQITVYEQLVDLLRDPSASSHFDTPPRMFPDRHNQ